VGWQQLTILCAASLWVPTAGNGLMRSDAAAGRRCLPGFGSSWWQRLSMCVPQCVHDQLVHVCVT
jgi:hypothetical protein